jgi:hypothetical protein
MKSREYRKKYRAERMFLEYGWIDFLLESFVLALEKQRARLTLEAG